MTIKAIETIYKGYRFRSRLEARYAVFFDTLGIPWEYEKEGYDLEGTRYLPDFWLPEQECWAEVKGEQLKIGSEDERKVRMLAYLSRKPVVVFWGQVDNLPDIYTLEERYSITRGVIEELTIRHDLTWAECPICHKISLVEYGWSRLSCKCWETLNSTDRISKAYTAARQARFDGRDPS